MSANQNDNYLNAISHDLKAPLVTISSFLQFLKKDLETEDYKKILDSIDRIEKANNKMCRIVDDLQIYSSLAHSSIKPGLLNIGEKLKTILAMNRHKTPPISLKVESDLPIIYTDPAMVETVFTSLISNILKNPPDLTVQPEITFELSAVEKLTETWFCLKNILGLNLESDSAIAAKAMERVGGRLWIDSKTGPKKEIWLAFPRDQTQ